MFSTLHECIKKLSKRVPQQPQPDGTNENCTQTEGKKLTKS